MLRFIRFAAVVGMFLAVADLCMVFLAYEGFFKGLRERHNLRAFAEDLHHLLDKMYYTPGMWFAYSGFLYLLAGMASRQLQQAAAKKEESEILNSDRRTTPPTVHSRAG